jgi:hypothetical protein
MTRFDPNRHPFTALANHHQPSAWPRDLLYGGGITLAAAILALGFAILRPTPRHRRREPPQPAPVFNRTRPRQ